MMVDTATRSPKGRKSVPAAKAIGTSGVVHYGSIIYHQEEYDRSWKGTERDRTIQSMLNDPLIGAILLGVEMLVRRVDWTVTAADDSPDAEAIAQFVRECLDDMDDHWPGNTLAKILTFLGWGWSVLEVTNKRRAGDSGDPPSRFDDGRIGWKRWALRPQITRYGWEFAGDDPTALVQQDPQSFRLLTIPLNKCLHFRYASRDNSPEGSTPLRQAFDAWYYKRQLQKIEAIGVERDLAGLPVMYIPGRDIEARSPVYSAAQTIVTGIRNDAQAGVVVSGDRDDHGNRLQEIELLSTGGQRAFDTDTIIKRYANEVVTVFLANVMRTGQDGVGSYALAETQGGLFQQAIGAHLDTIGQTITEDAILPLVRVNGFDDTLAPKLSHGDIESADLARLGAYLVNLAQAGVLVDTPELRAFVHEVAGLPVPSTEALEDIAEEEEERREVMADALSGGGDEDDDTDGDDDTEET